MIIRQNFQFLKANLEKNANIINKTIVDSECVESVQSARNTGAVIDENLCHHKLAMYAKTVLSIRQNQQKLGNYELKKTLQRW